RVLTASLRAVELRIGSLFSSRLRTNKGVLLRYTHTPTDQLQPTTKSDKLSKICCSSAGFLILYTCTHEQVTNMGGEGTPMPLYRVVEAYRTDAQEILLVLEHGETIYRVEGDADIVCADLDEARLAHCQGTPRLAPALLLAWREGYALGAPG